jgi:hypothetical protein
VEDGVEVVATREIAVVQLCAPSVAVHRPLLPTESAAVSICADASASCVDGIVRVCVAPGQPARLIAACTGGCATGISVEPGDFRTKDGAAAILCQRPHAERR